MRRHAGPERPLGGGASHRSNRPRHEAHDTAMDERGDVTVSGARRIVMAMDYDDKVVWITGGGTGIGRSLALAYADRGADVAISGRRLSKLESTVGEIEERGVEGRAVQCDVTAEEQVEAAVDRVVDDLGRLDIAIANAGFAISAGIEELSADDWRRQLDVNVVGVAITARHALPELRKTDGRMVLMGSVAGTVTMPDEVAYSASKYAVRAIGQGLAMELDDSPVSCTTLQPGFVESEIVKRDNTDEVHEDWEDRRPQMLVWPADKAAQQMVGAIERRRREYTFTGHGRIASFFGKHMPGFVHHAVSKLGG